jgi:hypothetical protein
MKHNVVPFIGNFLGIDNEEEIMNIVAILDTNAFGIQIPSAQITGCRGIYWYGAMMSHSCIPNTNHYIDLDMDMIVTACTDIKKGNMITTSYSSSLKTTIERRYQCKVAKCFDCNCSRCSDPTEFSSYSSALKCQKCVPSDGLVISLNPLDNMSDWKCNKCELLVSGQDYIKMIATIRQNTDTLNRKSPDDCERFLINFENLLPKQSVFLVDVKYVLCMLYGNISNYNYIGNYFRLVFQIS